MKIQPPMIHSVTEAAQGLRVEKITHFYGNFCALKNINFEVRRGEVCAILGPNGAGKTTLLRLLTGYFLPKEGEIFFGDHPLTQDPLKAKRLIGYLPEHFPSYDYLTLKEFMAWCLRLRDFRGSFPEEIKRVLGIVDLETDQQRLVGKLSKGMKQRLGLAQALLGDPPYLILDEPTSGMDPEQIRHIREVIRELKGTQTVILSTHILAEAAQVADRIVILSEGSLIASGEPRELERAYLHDEIVYRAGFRGHLHEIEERLKNIPNVLSFELVGSSPERHRLELRFQPGTEEDKIPEELSRAGLSLYEYARKELRLEDIFLKAVTEERRR